MTSIFQVLGLSAPATKSSTSNVSLSASKDSTANKSNQVDQFQVSDPLKLIQAQPPSPNPQLSPNGQNNPNPFQKELFKGIGKDNPTIIKNSDGTMSFNPETFDNHMDQGSLGDCFFVSSMNAALQDPKIGKAGLAKMITPFYDKDVQGKQTVKYKVTFPGYPDKPVIVDPKDIKDDKIHNTGVGEQILELGFAELCQQQNLLGTGTKKEIFDLVSEPGTVRTGSNQYDAINKGGDPGIALNALTGAESTDVNLRNTSDTKKALNNVSQNPSNYTVVASTYGDNDLKSKNAPDWVKGGHAYTVEVDPKTKQITVINPWDTQNDKYQITPEQLSQYFSDLSITKIN